MEEKIETEPRKMVRKEGVTYYLCQHLEEGLMAVEDASIWLGDERRVILCPLCNKLEFGNQVMAYAVMRGLSQKKYEKAFNRWIEAVRKWVDKNWDKWVKHD
jgi:hypothetical protein